LPPVLQCVAASCSVLQSVTVGCVFFRRGALVAACVAVCCGVLQCEAVCGSVLQRVAGTIKRNKIRNQITLLRGQAEDGVAFFLDKVEETINAYDNLLLTWGTHGTPLGDRKVKETIYKTVTRIPEEIEQWRENSSTDDTLSSLPSIETFLEEIHEMNHAILREEEDAATEFPSILKLLIKKIHITGNNPLIRQWWYDVMTSRPPPLPKNEEKYREEILDRVEEGWLDEEWTRTMPHLINDLLQKNFNPTRNPTSTRVSHVTEGIQWIRMEELGK